MWLSTDLRPAPLHSCSSGRPPPTPGRTPLAWLRPALARILFWSPLSELHQCFFHLFLGWRRTVELRIAFHERYAFTLNRMGDNGRRFAFRRGRFRKRSLQGGNAVAVHLDGVPFISAPFIGQGIERHDLIHEAI